MTMLDGVSGGVVAADASVDYEKVREEQMRRNRDRMRELKLPEASLSLQDRPEKKKRREASQRGVKRQKKEPVVARRSLRVRGLRPNGKTAQGVAGESNGGVTFTSSALGYGTFANSASSEPQGRVRKTGPVKFESIYDEDEDEQKILDLLRDAGAGAGGRTRGGRGGAKASTADRLTGLAGLAEPTLREENCAKVTKNGSVHLDMMPRSDLTHLIAAGDKEGRIGFWSVSQDFSTQMNTQVQPHSQYISGLKFCPSTGKDLWTCSYDGFCRKLDPSEGTFLEVFDSKAEHEFSAMDVGPCGGSAKAIFLCDNEGDFVIVDERAKKAAFAPVNLSHRKINTIHVEPSEGNLFCTSSTSAEVAVWDVRKFPSNGSKMSASKASVATYTHTKSCQGAYFARDGSHRVLTTCYDSHLNVWDAKKADRNLPVVRIGHNTQTGRWVLPFRAIWLPGSDGIVCGTMKRGLNIYEAASGKRAMSCDSEFLTAIPSRFCVHPTLPIVGAATSSGRIHLFCG